MSVSDLCLCSSQSLERFLAISLVYTCRADQHLPKWWDVTLSPVSLTPEWRVGASQLLVMLNGSAVSKWGWGAVRRGREGGGEHAWEHHLMSCPQTFAWVHWSPFGKWCVFPEGRPWGTEFIFYSSKRELIASLVMGKQYSWAWPLVVPRLGLTGLELCYLKQDLSPPASAFPVAGITDL